MKPYNLIFPTSQIHFYKLNKFPLLKKSLILFTISFIGIFNYSLSSPRKS